MAMTLLNCTVLMSGAEYFTAKYAINPYMNSNAPIDVDRAKTEHVAIKNALEEAGIKVIQVEAPEGCQDGVYTANWALCRGDVAILSSLPNKRQVETPYAQKVLTDLGKRIVSVPDGLRFSGQGDALPCGNYLFAGTNYRTDYAAHDFIRQTLSYEIVSLQTVPKRTWYGKRIINKETGWADSFFYDLDLALSVIREDLIAWCPEAFVPESQKILRNLPIDKIEVSLDEAKKGFACNLVSNGETVIMSANAPQLKAAIEAHGLKTITPAVNELGKGGGYIRCTTLTLDNA